MFKCDLTIGASIAPTAAQPMEASQRLCAFHGCARAKSIAVCHTGEVHLSVPRVMGENEDSRRSAISRSGSIATYYEL
jgi:hypothetical protein